MPITERERSAAIDHLRSSADCLRAAVQSFTQPDWTKRCGTAGWCAAEIVEHLALLEMDLPERIREHMQTRQPERGHDPEADARILALVPKRARKVEAPETMQPSGRWDDGPKALKAFLECREQTIAWMADTRQNLREVHSPHRNLGLLDGYQWVLLLAAHTDRHVAQILEIHAPSPDSPPGA